MKLIDRRPVTALEAEAIRALLQRAPHGVLSDASGSEASALWVVGICECGCDSLYFDGTNESGSQFIIADGLGYTEDGEAVGLILWAFGSQIVELEIYNHTERPARLPPPASICCFGESRRLRE